MTETKRSGEYALACGHVVRAELDSQARVICVKCKRETFVLRVIK